MSLAPVLLVGMTGIAVVGGLGAWDRLVRGRVGWFDLDTEASSASAFSAALLLAAAMASLLVAGARSPRTPRWPWLTTAMGLTELAVDERRALHERLEMSTGTDWQVLYLPVFLVGMAIGTVRLRLLPDGPIRWAFVGAIALWGLAQVSRRCSGRESVRSTATPS